jgi:hypothetical protein
MLSGAKKELLVEYTYGSLKGTAPRPNPAGAHHAKTSNIIWRFLREFEFHRFLRAAVDGLLDIGRVASKRFPFGLDESKVSQFFVSAMTNHNRMVKLVFSTYQTVK